MNPWKYLRRECTVLFSLAWLGAAAFAQSSGGSASVYYFTTLAGGSYADGAGNAARFNRPLSTALDRSGNLYVADAGNDVIRMITPAGVVTTLAGYPHAVGSADGQGSVARFNSPAGTAVDAAGNVYVADSGNYTVRKITPGGTVTTLAGRAGVSGRVDGTGGDARFSRPNGLAIDAAGNLYVGDGGIYRSVRKITPTGVVTTLAGSGNSGDADGVGAAASFNDPSSLAVDVSGNVYVSDHGNNTIRKIAPNGTTTTFAGKSGVFGESDGTGSEARFHAPGALGIDAAGNLFLSDDSGETIRKITPAGVVTTFAGSPGVTGIQDGVGSAAIFGGESSATCGMAVDRDGTLYFAESSSNTIRKISSAASVTTVAGLAISQGGADSTGIGASFTYPAVVVDAAANIFVADPSLHVIRKITPAGRVTTLAGARTNTTIVDGTGTSAGFGFPRNLTLDGQGNLYVVDAPFDTNANVSSPMVIRKVTPAGEVTTLAGSVRGNADGLGAAAAFNSPRGLASDSSGNIFVADSGNGTIRKITPAGMVTTFAGTAGQSGSADGVGSAASFNILIGMVIDHSDNLYVTDVDSTYGNRNVRIRQISPAAAVTTFATFKEETFEIGFGGYLAIDQTGNLFLTDIDQFGAQIRKITPAGAVSILAGKDSDLEEVDGVGLGARFAAPFSIATDRAGNLYLSDVGGVNLAASVIRKGIPLQASGSALSFTTQPASARIVTGDGKSVTLTAAAKGSSTPTYQWQKDGANIPGATANSYVLPNPGTADAGSYTVVAVNDSGAVISDTAILTVTALAANPATTAPVGAGHNATFYAGDTPGTIQWQVSTDSGSTWTNLSNDSTYSGTTTTVLTVANVTTALNGQRYRYLADNNNVQTTSNAVALAVATTTFFPFPTCITVDGSGSVYVGDAQANTFQKINGSGQVSLVAGTAGTAGSTDGTGAAARFNQPGGLALLSSGALIAADSANGLIRNITQAGVVSTLAGSAGNRGSADGTGSAATFSSPTGVAVDGSGNIFVADAMNSTIRKITSTGAVTTFAGSAGVTGHTDGSGNLALFNLPSAVAVDSGGNVYVTDANNNTIRKITSAGVVSTLAGLFGVSGSDDGNQQLALFNHPGGLKVDSAGNIYVADTGNSTIRRVTAAGVVTTIAGLPGVAGLADGADGLFNQPRDLALDASGNLYVADTGNAAIRKITPQGVVSTLALTAAPASSGDAGTGASGGGGSTSGGSSSGGSSTPTPSSGSGGGGSIGGGFVIALLGLDAVRRLTARKR